MAITFFSIIIPTYNSAVTLTACLNSIVDQSFSDWEVLIMDGLSADDTVAIASSYAAKFPAVKIISQKDKGIFDAMNKGIETAEGHWLYFMGSDDVFFDKNVLRDIAIVIREHTQAGIIYGDVYSERFRGLYDGEFSRRKIRKYNISHQAIFFKKTIFEVTGLFELKYKAQSDWDHNLKWILSPRIQNKYVPITIANYADGGFSSINGDPVFFADLNFNYIRYGVLQLSAWEKIKLLFYEFFKSIKRGEWERLKKVLSHIRYI